MLILSIALLSCQLDVEGLLSVHSDYSSESAITNFGVRAHVKDEWALNEYMKLTIGGYAFAGDYIADESKVVLSHFSTRFNSVFGDNEFVFGRMPLDLGNSILTSVNSWQFEPYFHDGVLLGTSFKKMPVQAFYLNAATGLPGARDDVLSGFFLELPDKDFTTTYLRREQYEAAIDEYNIALHLFKDLDSGLLFDGTVIFQQGDDGVRDISSLALASSVTKELDFGHKVGLSFYLAQGDKQDPTNRTSYSPGLIDRHEFAGKADVLSFSNLIDIVFEYELVWNEYSSFHIDLHGFFRQTTSDGVYLFDKSRIVSASSSAQIARELDIYISSIYLDAINLKGGWSMFQWQDSSITSGEKAQYVFYLHADYSF